MADEKLEHIYCNLTSVEALAAPSILAKKADVSLKKGKEFIEEEESYTLHGNYKNCLKHFRKTISYSFGDIAEVYILVLDNNFVKFNKPYEYLLIVIDVFCRFLNVFPLISKKAIEIVKHLDKFFSHSPFQKLQTGRGKVFLRIAVKRVLEKRVKREIGNIILYPTYLHKKCSIDGRVIVTLRIKINQYCI